MSVAERTREAVRARPFLRDALAAGVLNYAAAAERLDVDAGGDAVAAALRRYESELTRASQASESASARVRLQRGLERVQRGPERAGSEATDPLLAVGGEAYRTGDGRLAAVTARGDAVGARELERVLGRLRTAEVGVEAAAVGGETLVVLVSGRASADALRLAEAVFE